jgi:VanZ family protein
MEQTSIIKLNIFYRLPVIIYCTFIFIHSSRPGFDTPDVTHIDKVFHFFGYAVCGALFLRAFRTFSIRHNLKLLIILSMLASGLYGLSDEIHQYFVPCRTADFLDILANLLGSIAGVAAYQFWLDKKSKFYF